MNVFAEMPAKPPADRVNANAVTKARVAAYNSGYDDALRDVCTVLMRRKTKLRENGEILHATMIDRLWEDVRRNCAPEDDEE